MVANDNADNLVQFPVRLPPLELVPDEPRNVVHNPVPQAGLFFHLQLNVDDPAGFGAELEVDNRHLVLPEKAPEDGVFHGEPVIVVFGDVQHGFEKRRSIVDVFLIAEYLGKRKVVQGRNILKLFDNFSY